MKNTIGSAYSVTIFGESHGSATGVVIDSPVPGLELDEDDIRKRLDRRRPSGNISTARREMDEYSIVSGLYNGRCTGTPLTVIIPNSDVKSRDYDDMLALARPSHADYTAQIKYNGFQDPRGGGHFSGRLTAALTVAGAVSYQMLARKEIIIGTHVIRLAGVSDRAFSDVPSDIAFLEDAVFPALDENAGNEMKAAVEATGAEGDSVGGILETAVYGLPAGVGEPWFDTVEGMLSHALFSVPAVKGVEFGAGFSFADMKGSEANDSLRSEDGKIYTETNNNGGINGGITNGMPVIFRCAVKPTPSIYKPQNTVNLKTGENTVLTIEGRHDPAVAHRAAPVISAVTAIALVDILAGRYGIDYFGEG